MYEGLTISRFECWVYIIHKRSAWPVESWGVFKCGIEWVRSPHTLDAIDYLIYSRPPSLIVGRAGGGPGLLWRSLRLSRIGPAAGMQRFEIIQLTFGAERIVPSTFFLFLSPRRPQATADGAKSV